MAVWRVLGAMSGSSADGLDLALCALREVRGGWRHAILKAGTVRYPDALRVRLLHAAELGALDLAVLDADLGRFIARACSRFLKGERAGLIASHGHTVIHRPELGVTVQLGGGARIAAITGLPVVSDLRCKDVALGGQGAPLVPLGEQLLFPGHKAFLNIGGICNIGLHGERTTGYDVCIGNQALDHLARQAGQRYDRGGALARRGKVDAALLAHLDALPFHRRKPPKSLGREWFETEFRPLLDAAPIGTGDRLRTTVEHIARQVARALRHAPGRVLVTGGGAHNRFLLERIATLSPVPLDLPDKDTIDQKEAVIFALLGLLRWLGRPNALASVTGATRDSVGGAVYLPN